MRNYQQAADYLGRKADRPLSGRATRLQRRDADTIAVKYQQTDVVTYRADGSVVLNSDGWHTSTTRERINEYSPARVWQSKSIMYIGAAGDYGNGRPYVDGIVIAADGAIIMPAGSETAVDTRAQLVKQIAKYARGFRKAIESGAIAEPSRGDCLYCQMELSQRMTGNTGIQYGQLTADGKHTDLTHVGPSPAQHIPDHLEEQYYMGSLLANAIIARRFGNPQVVYSMIVGRKDGKWASQIVRWYLKSLLPQLTA